MLFLDGAGVTISPELIDTIQGLSGGAVAILVLYAVVMGKGLALMREVKTRDETIAYQRERITELVSQTGLVIREQGPAVNQFMSGVRQAASDKGP